MADTTATERNAFDLGDKAKGKEWFLIYFLLLSLIGGLVGLMAADMYRKSRQGELQRGFTETWRAIYVASRALGRSCSRRNFVEAGHKLVDCFRGRRGAYNTGSTSQSGAIGEPDVEKNESKTQKEEGGQADKTQGNESSAGEVDEKTQGKDETVETVETKPQSRGTMGSSGSGRAGANQDSSWEVVLMTRYGQE